MSATTFDPQAVKTSAATAFYRPELDVLRFFAFLAVFACHIATHPPDYFTQRHISARVEGIWLNISTAGSYGVDLFFVLSAYLITELLIREKEKRGALDVRSFYIRRILRIWPLYFFFIAVVVFVPPLNAQHQLTWRYIVPLLLLLGNWSMVAFGWPDSVADPLWSISVEEQFYLLWPPIVCHLNRRGTIVAAWIMIALAEISRIVVLLLHGSAPQLWGTTFAHLDSIGAGILLAVSLHAGAPALSSFTRRALIALAFTVLVVRAHCVVVLARDSLGWGETLLGSPLVAASCAVIVIAFVGSGIRAPLLRYLGKISYGLYVYHLLCIRIAEKILQGQTGAVHMVARILLSLGLTILFAAVSYSLIEKRFLELKKRFAYVASRPV